MIVSVSDSPNNQGNEANNKTESNQARSFMEDRRVSIMATKFFLEDQQKQLSKEIETIKGSLKGDVSEEDRKKLEERLRQLENEFAENKLNISIIQEEAENTIAELQDAFFQERKDKKKTEDELKNTKENARLQKELSDTRTTQSYIIFSIVASALIIIVSVFYFKNLKINKQKNQLEEKNQKLITTSRIVEQQNKEIQTKNDRLVKQTKELEEKNTKITDSLRYAETIQSSILPNETELNNAFAEHFILYKPKDIVSGDFYWLKQKGNQITIAVGDCTGHGVPGAFMTMIGNTLLNQIFTEDNITDPAEALTTLNAYFVSMLKHNQSGQIREGDGMDIAILNFNLTEKTVTFAGAKHPLYYVKNDELFYIKGTSLSIGTTTAEKTGKTFKSRTIKLEGDEVFYLTSDGFQDQLGLEKSNGSTTSPKKKYMKTRLMDLMVANHHLSMAEQRELYYKEFKQWKGKLEQTDDVLCLAFKF
jgi:serine phosphatase RsbU (regulator of sigma subunit)